MKITENKKDIIRTGYWFKKTCLLLLLLPQILFSQGYLHRQGKFLYDGSNNEIILRGIGTGNWMIQEGYMMQTSDVALTMHEFRARLIDIIGETNTDSFYNIWLTNHFTRTDVDSMKAWGFNSVRVAMHYKWFTLPIEEEPVNGQNTWLDKGFRIIDSLLDWCSDNQMYLILDMHATPGGQGNDAAISDYDNTKDHLWENQQNKDKLVALWHKLAERYATEPWIGGYDLINETNYTFPEGNNSQMRSLFGILTNSIREADTNHLIIIEGNSYANDFSGLTPTWDNKMLYSFHNYWSSNSENKLDWIISLRNSQNVPIWLGESGENSNSWYSGMIALCEKNNIGWSWWPVKKAGLNNPLKVTVNSDYISLINYWRGSAEKPTANAAFQAVLTFAENHKIENCFYQKDVVDAMIRQPFTSETKPFKIFRVGDTVFASDFDLGRVGHAYYDDDTANNSGSPGGANSVWNQGYSYRNDGVDIEESEDATSNGYDVGWTNDKEWMQYTVYADSSAAYTLVIRHASGSGGSIVHFEIDGIPVTGRITLNGTGGWQTWSTKQVSDVLFPAGTHKVKLYFDQGGSNIGYFKFSNPKPSVNVGFKNIYATSTTDGTSILLTLNKKITSGIGSISVGDFVVKANTIEQFISGFSINPADSSTIIIEMSEPLNYGSNISISYSGNSIMSNAQLLESFSDLYVLNLLPLRYNVPCRIQAEKFYENKGFELETCTDAGGGQNTSYANVGDYLDYLINVTDPGVYHINYRFATQRSDAVIILQTNESGTFKSIDTISFKNTGGWQNWQTLSSSQINLESGRYTLRILDKQSEFNLNWFEIIAGLSSVNTFNTSFFRVYPNPAGESSEIVFQATTNDKYKVRIIDLVGKIVFESEYSDSAITFKPNTFSRGMYIIYAESENHSKCLDRLIII